MSKKDEQYYAVHNDGSPHLHAYDSQDEGQREIEAYKSYAVLGDTVGPTLYSASELIFILWQTPQLRELCVVAAELIQQDPFNPAFKRLRQHLAKIADGVVLAFKAGQLDSSLDEQQVVDLTDAVAARDELRDAKEGVTFNPEEDLLATLGESLKEVEKFLTRKIRVVDSTFREGRSGISPIVGQVFEVQAYNPVTKEARIIPGGNYGTEVLTLSPDEYIVLDAVPAR